MPQERFALERPRRLQRLGNGCPGDGKEDHFAESHGIGGRVSACIGTGGGGNGPQLLLIFAEAEQDLVAILGPNVAHAGPHVAGANDADVHGASFSRRCRTKAKSRPKPRARAR